MTKIAHLTSVHSRTDTRVFVRQCQSLAKGGFSVYLVTADGMGSEKRGGVNIVDVGRLSGRWNRMVKTTRRVLKKAIELDADIYHLHDPELLPIGLKLKRRGKKVIFDSHEDVPKQTLAKPYLGPIRLGMIAWVLSVFERFACSRFDGVIAATPPIRDKFLTINPVTVDINNFPMPGELSTDVSWEQRKAEICYIGWLTEERGIRELVSALDRVKSPIRLNLVGNFDRPDFEEEVKSLPGWSRVNELGFQGREGVREALSRSVIGMVTLRPLVNYLDSQPVKMFEYMSAGLPVIASDFELWRTVLERNDCGLCVDPMDPGAIAEAIDSLVTDPDRACMMGLNGHNAVLQKYNWPVEENKLFSFYESLLSTPAA